MQNQPMTVQDLVDISNCEARTLIAELNNRYSDADWNLSSIVPDAFADEFLNRYQEYMDTETSSNGSNGKNLQLTASEPRDDKERLQSLAAKREATQYALAETLSNAQIAETMLQAVVDFYEQQSAYEDTRLALQAKSQQEKLGATNERIARLQKRISENTELKNSSAQSSLTEAMRSQQATGEQLSQIKDYVASLLK